MEPCMEEKRSDTEAYFMGDPCENFALQNYSATQKNSLGNIIAATRINSSNCNLIMQFTAYDNNELITTVNFTKIPQKNKILETEKF